MTLLYIPGSLDNYTDAFFSLLHRLVSSLTVIQSLLIAYLLPQTRMIKSNSLIQLSPMLLLQVNIPFDIEQAADFNIYIILITHVLSF